MARGTKRFGRVPTGGQHAEVDDFDQPTRAHPSQGQGQSQKTAIGPSPARPGSAGGPAGSPAGGSPGGPAGGPAPAQTVMMQAARPGSSGGGGPSAEPPEIGLTEHAIDTDGPLDPRLVIYADADSERAAAFRVLRHHLLEHGRPQVVVVSSPHDNQAKTLCAVNLALALSECGRARVLLCEADVARPQLARIFNFMPPWCFAEQLDAHRHQSLLPWQMVNVPELFLHVAAINPGIERTQLLDAPAFSIAMDRLRLAGYDHIVIDAPAVLGSADVNLIQDASDGVVLALEKKRTTARALRGAVEQLTQDRVIGTILVE